MTSYELREFEWLPDLDLATVEPLVASIDRDGLCVVPGCGTSCVSATLRDGWGFRRVLSLDSDAAAIDFMRARQRDDARRCDFVVADATDCADVVADGAAALVVDKSTLDCLLCSDAAAYACSVARMLAVGGCFLVMSFHDAEFLKAALCAALPFCVEREVVREKDVALLLRRTAGAWEPEAVAAALLRPTVPPERLARLRASWGGARPLREAYDLLFSDALKAEYAFADFEADAGSADRWSLDDALAFLRRTQ